MFLYRFAMSQGSISFVDFETVLGELAGLANHVPVAPHLGNNRGERNYLKPLIATDKGALVCKHGRGKETTVKKQSCFMRRDLKFEQCPPHSNTDGASKPPPVNERVAHKRN